MSFRLQWSGSLILVLTALSGAQPAFSQLACGQGGDCCQPHNTPFCNDLGCCDLVCAVDCFCCSVAWDAICVNESYDVCPGLCTTGPGACCTSTGGVFTCADDVPAAECAAADGTPYGPGTACAATHCGAPICVVNQSTKLVATDAQAD
ncbi:MAG TPA: hypothetical protein VGM03_17195, partial [Phycisphaerae bacterium]